MIRFIVPGEPVGKGRPRAFRMGAGIRMYTPKKTESYESKVVAAASVSNMPVDDTLTGALTMTVQAYFGIPKSMSKKLRQYAEDNFLHVTKKPDADNIAKIICDALNGFAYKDDSQIAELTVTKAYSRHPRVEVTISKVDYSLRAAEELAA